jgi:hypothetical protein
LPRQLTEQYPEVDWRALCGLVLLSHKVAG